MESSVQSPNINQTNQIAVAESLSLVLFDCDGVLVDTEKFYVELLLEFAAEYGVQMSFPEAMQTFSSITLRKCIAIIEEISGKKLPDDFLEVFRETFAERIGERITIIEGVKDVINGLAVPMCVASNSSMGSLKQMLTLVELYQYFEGRIYSAYDLKKWKPDPGLFLHAASEMKVDPKNCLVIEDSVGGIQAAKAAGMRVFGYAASEYTGKNLLSQGVPIFFHMNELPQMISSLQTKAA